MRELTVDPEARLAQVGPGCRLADVDRPTAWPPHAAGRAAGADRFRRWVRDAWRRLRPFSTGATYVNFQTADEGEDRVRATYGADWERPVEVKRRWDPDNLFRSSRNVRP
jgi:FAD/FMN-containing dehydrogenase